MEKINVAVITKNLEINGINSVALNYSCKLNIKKFNVTIFTGLPINEKNLLRCEQNNIKCVKLPTKGFSYYKELLKKLKNGKYDVIHIHGSSSTVVIELIIAYLCKVKKRIVHSHSTNCNNKMLHYILRPLIKLFATDMIACGNTAGKWMFKNKKYYILNNCIDINKYNFNNEKRNEIRRDLGIENKFVIGHVGRFNYVKNQKYLIDLFANMAEKNKNLVLVFYGIGPTFEKIHEYIQNLKYKDRIILVGEVENTENVYNIFDVLTLPSLYEGLPLVLVEAQANGLKCLVSTNVPRDAKLTNSVKFIPLEDETEWKKEIQDLIENGEDQKERETNSLNNSKDITDKGFDLDKNVKKLEKIYLGD